MLLKLIPAVLLLAAVSPASGFDCADPVTGKFTNGADVLIVRTAQRYSMLIGCESPVVYQLTPSDGVLSQTCKDGSLYEVPLPPQTVLGGAIRVDVSPHFDLELCRIGTVERHQCGSGFQTVVILDCAD